MLKSYLSITKPGIIFGNLISVAAGFFLAAKSEPANFLLLLTTLVGVGLVIASGCVVNNIFDRDIDQKMKRTQNRELVMGNINIDAAFVYALVLLLNGTALLFQLVKSALRCGCTLGLRVLRLLLHHVVQAKFGLRHLSRQHFWRGSSASGLPCCDELHQLRSDFTLHHVLSLADAALLRDCDVPHARLPRCRHSCSSR